uniref:NAC transcription factor 30 n=1 Tax=Haloxylon ammodendron TaxID=151230 RepID=A0A1B2RWE2_9CARY|nr:NAC transcription factor 30 [Haloxylon ammodendron]
MGRNSSSSTSLAPGFRFHPTDEELVWYYLRRKVCGKPFRVDAISEIDIYKVEPSDLPGLSKLKTRDQEWYFFSALDRKYGHGSRTNRATNEGYWKTTGKDRPITHGSRVVGMKKTLVYHRGRAPRGLRTNWVMHEYKLIDEVLEKAGFFPDGFVLCRVFQKSGSGPKNGEQYGAPLVEEEWEDDNLGVVSPCEVSFEDPYVDDDAYIEQDDLDKVLDSQLPENIPFAVSLNYDGNNYLENSLDIAETEQKSVESEDKLILEALDDQKLYDLLASDDNSASVGNNEHMAEPNNLNDEVPAISFDELFSDNAAHDDGLFLDAFDFLEPVQNSHNFENVGSYLDDDFDIRPFLNFDSPDLMDNDVNQVFSTKQNTFDGTWQIPSASQQLQETGDNGMASSSKRPKTDMQYPFIKKASNLLGNIPAPPAFASELPSKDIAARLSAAMQSSRSMPAGMIKIRDMPFGSSTSGLHWSFDKTGIINVLLSFDLPEAVSPVGMESLGGLLSSKVSTAASRCWFYFMFLVFVFAISFNIGTCIYAK